MYKVIFQKIKSKKDDNFSYVELKKSQFLYNYFPLRYYTRIKRFARVNFKFVVPAKAARLSKKNLIFLALANSPKRLGSQYAPVMRARPIFA